MELKDAFSFIEKYLENTNKELGFSSFKKLGGDECRAFKGNKGIYRLAFDRETQILALECADENMNVEQLESSSDDAENEFKTVSKTLFEADAVDERECKSVANEIADELRSLYATRKKVDLDKVKMPKGVSRGKAKSGIVSYDTDSLANRFGVLFPDLKDEVKKNIADYGEFLPETFFAEVGTERVLDIIKNGTQAEQKKLFKMLGEIYEDGTNEVQDIIGVTILGEMKNDPKMMAVADMYMTEYMAGPVHEINKLTAKNNKWTKKLKNPPAYKPKKKKNAPLQNALGQ